MRNRITVMFAMALAVFFGSYQTASPATFGSPAYSAISSGCSYGSTDCFLPGSYHTGIDYRANASLDVISANNGKVARVENMSASDHGMGNNIIIEHRLLDGTKIYSSYSHLASIELGIVKDKNVVKGEKIGTIGGSGYGNFTYWSTHLHFEMKDLPVTGNPSGIGSYWGYTTSSPDDYGYKNPNNYFGTVEALDPNIVGQRSAAFVSDTMSQSFIDDFCRHSPKIGWPVNYVHKWTSTFGYRVYLQDFQGDMSAEYFGWNGQTALIYNNINDGFQLPAAYLVKEGMWDYYRNHDGPATLGEPFTEEITLRYATNSQPYQPGDPVKAGDTITVQAGIQGQQAQNKHEY